MNTRPHCVLFAALLAIGSLSVAAHAASLAPANAALAPSANSVPAPAPSMHSPAAPASHSAHDIAAEDIRDIRPPYHLPPGWLWLAWVAGGCALAALGYGAWRWRHRLGVRVKLPYELALERLEAARRLMQPEHARDYSIHVSEVVREYIEQRFAVRAAHRTTEEFLHDLVAQPDSPLATHRPSLAEFLQHCDLAKFARWMLSVPQMEAMLQSAAAFIVATGQPMTNKHNSTAHSVGVSSPPPPIGARLGAPVSSPANS